MDGRSRVKYEAYLRTKKIRDDLELGIDDTDPFEEVFNDLTNMQKIVFVLLEYSLSPKFIYTHLGISRQRYGQIVQGIRNKLISYMERGDEV